MDSGITDIQSYSRISKLSHPPVWTDMDLEGMPYHIEYSMCRILYMVNGKDIDQRSSLF